MYKKHGLAMTVTLLIVLFMTLGCGTEEEDSELVIMTHDSFDISKEVISEFESENNATVVIQKAGDAGQTLVRAILEKGNPSADLLYGIDNTYLGRALDENIFDAYKPELLSKIPEILRLDPTNHVTPIDYGYVTLNYDKDYLSKAGLVPPSTLEELTENSWKGKVVVENPAVSSPGLAFLLATIDYFGEDDDYDYLDFWKAMRSNDVLVKDGWSDAYYTDFSLYGGDRPLVVSYATSPAAEVYFSEIKLLEPPTGNILIDKGSFLQIEGIGILKGANSKTLAKKFIDFALGVRFQEDFPAKMFVYPVNIDAKVPDFFKFAEIPTEPADITPEEINAHRDQWIESWTTTMMR